MSIPNHKYVYRFLIATKDAPVILGEVYSSLAARKFYESLAPTLRTQVTLVTYKRWKTVSGNDISNFFEGIKTAPNVSVTTYEEGK